MRQETRVMTSSQSLRLGVMNPIYFILMGKWVPISGSTEYFNQNADNIFTNFDLKNS